MKVVSTIAAGYRSAIFAYHEPVGRFKLGEHPGFLILLSGIFNNRPTQPKFNFVWDVKNVLDFLETMNSEGLSVKELTLKLTMHLPLILSARVQLS